MTRRAWRWPPADQRARRAVVGTVAMARLALVEENPDLYHMVFDDPILGFMPTPESMEEVRKR
jgi:hypothetical protein